MNLNEIEVGQEFGYSRNSWNHPTRVKLVRIETKADTVARRASPRHSVPAREVYIELLEPTVVSNMGYSNQPTGTVVRVPARELRDPWFVVDARRNRVATEAAEKEARFIADRAFETAVHDEFGVSLSAETKYEGGARRISISEAELVSLLNLARGAK